MFASIAAGIACGVSGFVIAFMGTLSFCIVAVILRFTSFSQANNLIGTLTFELPKGETMELIESVLKKYCEGYLLKSYRIVTTGKKEGRTGYDYQVKVKSVQNSTDLVSTLQAMDNVKAVRLDFEDMDFMV